MVSLLLENLRKLVEDYQLLAEKLDENQPLNEDVNLLTDLFLIKEKIYTTYRELAKLDFSTLYSEDIATLREIIAIRQMVSEGAKKIYI